MPRSANGRGYLRCLPLFSLVFVVAWFAVVFTWPTLMSNDIRERYERQTQRREPEPFRPRQSSKLVVYVFSGSDPEYSHNLEFFIREGIQVRDGVPTCFVHS